MGVLGTVLFVLGCIMIFVLYMIVGITMQMFAHTFLMVYFNSKKTLRRIVKPHIQIKSYDMDFYWRKSDFGDFKTRWKLLNTNKRNCVKIELYFDKYGNITYIENDRWDDNLTKLQENCHDGLDLKSIIKSR